MMLKKLTIKSQERSYHSANSYLVMIVDDDKEFSVELSIALKERAVDCLIASTAEEALNIINRNPEIAVVITDIVLPRMSGLELLRRLRLTASPAPLHAIIVTGYASIDYAVAALRGSAGDFLQKPIDFDDLYASVTRGLQSRKVKEGAPPLYDKEDPTALDLISTVRSVRELVHEEGMSEVAWQLLIEAARAHFLGIEMTVTNLCSLSGAPLATALRHLSMLQQNGYVNRADDPIDGRRSLVYLTESGANYIKHLLFRWTSRLSKANRC